MVYTFALQLPGPLDIPASVEVFRRWGDDLLDRWDGHALVRTVRIGEAIVPFVCTVTGSVEEPAVEITVAQSNHASYVEQMVQTMFVIVPSPLAKLTETDAVVARLETHYRGVRPVLQADLFAALVRSISAQQVNLRWAATTRRRLTQTFGRRHTLGEYQIRSLEAERLAGASVAALRALQFTARKAEYIIALAVATTDGSLDLEALRQQPDAAVIARLTALRGIGHWTAEWFLARALGRPRVVAGDLGVRKAVAAAYLHGRMPSEAEVRKCTAHWGDAAGVAQQLLLHDLSAGMDATSSRVQGKRMP